MRVVPIRYPLVEFQAWLRSRGAASSTLVVYCSRVRAVLSYAKCLSDYPADVAKTVEESWIMEYLNCLSPGTRTQTVSAWRAFVTFAQTEGAQLPLIEPQQVRASLQDIATVIPVHVENVQGIPMLIASAVWDLVRDRSHAPSPGLLLSLTWRSVLIWSGSHPATTPSIEISDHGTVYSYRKPHTAFCLLWDWTRGTNPAPDRTQPLIPEVSGGQQAISADALHAILSLGRRDRLPRLVDAPVPLPEAPLLVPDRPYYAPPPPLLQEASSGLQLEDDDPFDTP